MNNLVRVQNDVLLWLKQSRDEKNWLNKQAFDCHLKVKKTLEQGGIYNCMINILAYN